jgi:hypothetical protein
LKYWRVIQMYIKRRYKLSQTDIDCLMFLYSEKYFTITKFKEYENLLFWDKDRFNSLKKRGWIEVFRVGDKRAAIRKRVATIYCLSIKGTRLISSIYKKLSGEEIPEMGCINPMFKRNVRYTDKVYRMMIKTMNEEIRQAKATGQVLHLVPE